MEHNALEHLHYHQNPNFYKCYTCVWLNLEHTLSICYKVWNQLNAKKVYFATIPISYKGNVPDIKMLVMPSDKFFYILVSWTSSLQNESANLKINYLPKILFFSILMFKSVLVYMYWIAFPSINVLFWNKHN